MWPAAGVEPVPERTDETIQRFSACSVIAAHCAFFLDLYLTHPRGLASWAPPAEFQPLLDEAFLSDGAIEIPALLHGPGKVLAYVETSREKMHGVVPPLTEEDLASAMPEGHPWAGTSFGDLLRINLAHLIEHGGQVATLTG